MMLPRKEKKYMEMSPFEKQIRYKDLKPWEILQLHHEEMGKLAEEQMKQRQMQVQKKRVEQQQRKDQ